MFSQLCLSSNEFFWVLIMALEKDNELGDAHNEIKASRVTQALQEKAIDEVLILTDFFLPHDFRLSLSMYREFPSVFFPTRAAQNYM